MLEEKNFFEASFSAFEKGLACFKYPHAFLLWYCPSSSHLPNACLAHLPVGIVFSAEPRLSRIQEDIPAEIRESISGKEVRTCP
jgi:hypothetical protein